jgi:hypothetical protein
MMFDDLAMLITDSISKVQEKMTDGITESQ